MAQIEQRDYFGIVEAFLRDVQKRKIRCMALVALTDEDDETHDVFATWNSTAFDISDMSGVMQLHAAIDYVEARSQEMMEEGYEENDWPIAD